MSKTKTIEDFRSELKNTIVGICNTIGCDSCSSKWEGGCLATELQNKIIDLEDSPN